MSLLSFFRMMAPQPAPAAPEPPPPALVLAPNEFFVDFKEEKIKKGKARIIKYYLTTNEGRVVLAAEGEETSQGDAHYHYKNTDAVQQFGSLSAHNRKELMAFLQQVMAASRHRAGVPGAEPVATAAAPADSGQGAPPQAAEQAPVVLTGFRVEKSMYSDQRRGMRFYVITESGQEILAATGEERDTRDGHYTYRSEPGVAVHSPLNVGNMSGVHKWLNELIVASGGKPQGAIVPTTLIDMPVHSSKRGNDGQQRLGGAAEVSHLRRLRALRDEERARAGDAREAAVAVLMQVARQERSVRERVRGVVEGFMKGEPNEEEARVMAQGRKVLEQWEAEHAAPVAPTRGGKRGGGGGGGSGGVSAATVIDVLVGLRGVRATLRGLQGSGIAEVVVRLAREGGVGAEEQAIGVRALQAYLQGIAPPTAPPPPPPLRTPKKSRTSAPPPRPDPLPAAPAATSPWSSLAMTEREAVSAAAGALLALWHALLALSLAGISQSSLLREDPVAVLERAVVSGEVFPSGPNAAGQWAGKGGGAGASGRGHSWRWVLSHGGADGVQGAVAEGADGAGAGLAGAEEDARGAADGEPGPVSASAVLGIIDRGRREAVDGRQNAIPRALRATAADLLAYLRQGEQGPGAVGVTPLPSNVRAELEARVADALGQEPAATEQGGKGAKSDIGELFLSIERTVAASRAQ